MRTKQTSMFDETNADLPLFSGTPVKAEETSTKKNEQGHQPGLFSLWPYTDPKAALGKQKPIQKEPAEPETLTLLTDQIE